MITLPESTIAALLAPYLDGANISVGLYSQLGVYLDLLMRWNARTNLTAIRNPDEIVRRHFGESLFLGWNLSAANTLLDFGSGAGFPGLPIQLLRPELRVTLAESQRKKASFLREVVRTLELSSEIWADRVEALPSDRVFDIVTVRAVDKMDSAVQAAKLRVAPGGVLALLGTSSDGSAERIQIPGGIRRSIFFIR